MLTRHQQAVCRTAGESLEEVATVKEVNEEALSDARLDAQGELAAYTAELWLHHMKEDQPTKRRYGRSTRDPAG